MISKKTKTCAERRVGKEGDKRWGGRGEGVRWAVYIWQVRQAAGAKTLV
jgi:hypothetical protein